MVCAGGWTLRRRQCCRDSRWTAGRPLFNNNKKELGSPPAQDCNPDTPQILLIVSDTMAPLWKILPYSRVVVKIESKAVCEEFVRAAASMGGSDGDHIVNNKWGVPVGSRVLWPAGTNVHTDDFTTKLNSVWCQAVKARGVVVDTADPLVSEFARFASPRTHRVGVFLLTHLSL